MEKWKSSKTHNFRRFHAKWTSPLAVWAGWPGWPGLAGLAGLAGWPGLGSLAGLAGWPGWPCGPCESYTIYLQIVRFRKRFLWHLQNRTRFKPKSYEIVYDFRHPPKIVPMKSPKIVYESYTILKDLPKSST